MRSIIILCFIFILGTSIVQGQDVHFTRFNDAPMTLNPAKTGDYLGTFRIGGIIRDQNYNLSSVYLTPSAYLDLPLVRGFAKTHWVGAGITFLQDQAGVAGLRTSNFMGSLAYHIGFNKEMSSYFTLGASYGLVARKLIDKDKLIFEDGINSGSSLDPADITDDVINYNDLNGGVQFTGGLSNGGLIKIGLAGLHLNKPKYSLLKTGNSTIPIRINAYGVADFPVNTRVDLIPAIYFATMDGHRDIALQLSGALKLNTLKNLRLIGGVGYRIGDAVEFLAGLDYKNMKVGLSYDLTLNPIRPTGGFEVSISNVFMVYKKPKDNPIILCPRI